MLSCLLQKAQKSRQHAFAAEERRCKPPITFDVKDTCHVGVFSAILVKEMASDALSTSA